MSREEYLGGCTQAEKDFELGEVDCCRSCHSEEADGYSSFSEFQTEDGYYEVCCAVLDLLKRKKEPVKHEP